MAYRVKYLMTNHRLRKTFITFCNCTKSNVTFVHMKANTLLLSLLLFLLCNHNQRQNDGSQKTRPWDRSSFQRHRERSRAGQVTISTRAGETLTAGGLLRTHTERHSVPALQHICNRQQRTFSNRWRTHSKWICLPPPQTASNSSYMLELYMKRRTKLLIKLMRKLIFRFAAWKESESLSESFSTSLSKVHAVSRTSCSLHSNRAECRRGNSRLHDRIQTQSVVLFLKDQRGLQKKMTTLFGISTIYIFLSQMTSKLKTKKRKGRKVTEHWT